MLPGAKVKLNELGVAVSTPDVPVTLRLTCTCREFGALEVPMLMKPTLLPDVGAFAPTDTVTFNGVVPLAAFIWSQPEEKLDSMMAVAPAEEVIWIV